MQISDPEVRETVLRRHRRRRSVRVSLAVCLLTTVAAAVGVGVVRGTTKGPGEPPDRVPRGVSADRSGVSVGGGPVRVDLYVDYLCPECRKVGTVLAPRLRSLAEAGTVTVVHHPVAFLDDRSVPAGYSGRASAAAACAADQDRFEEYDAALFSHQPPERGPGPDTEQLIDIGREAGITVDAFARCLREARYVPWARYVTDLSASHGVTVTPSLFVGGDRIDVTASDALAALDRAVADARTGDERAGSAAGPHRPGQAPRTNPPVRG